MQVFFNNAFQNVCRFQDIRGQRFDVLAPKILYYVTYDLNYGMIRLRSHRATVQLLKPISNYQKANDMFKRLLTPFYSLFKGPAPFVWYQKKGHVISNIFCSISVQKFSIIFEIFKKEYFRGQPRNSLTGPFRKKNENYILLSA